MHEMNELSQEMIKLFAFKYYRKFKKHLVFTLMLSRLPFFKTNGKYLLFLQRIMASELAKIHRVIREGKELVTKEADQKVQKSLRLRINAHKHLARVLKTIADGIAWRNLKFNRPLLRLLSDNDSPGHIDKELDTIFNVKPFPKEILIVNDLTNYCRIGDFIIITKDKKVIIYEAKSRLLGSERAKLNIYDIKGIIQRRLKNKNEFTKQELRHIVAQKAIISNKINIPIITEDKNLKKELSIEIQDIDVPIFSYIKDIKRLIKDATKNFYACSPLYEGYFVEFDSYDTLFKKTEIVPKILKEMDGYRSKNKPEWFKDNENVMKLDSYYVCYQKDNEFARNFTPPTVLPIPASAIVRLLMGFLRFRIYFHLPVIDKKLKLNGWNIKDFDWKKSFEDSRKQQSVNLEKPLFTINSSGIYRKVSKKIGTKTFHSEISLTDVLQAMSAFYDPCIVVDALEFRLKNSEQLSSRLFSPNYTQENKILI